MAYVFSNAKEYDLAKKSFSQLLISDDIMAQSAANLWFGRRLIAEGKINEGLSHIHNYFILEDSLNNVKHEEAVALSQSLYNYQLKEREIHTLQIEGYRHKVYIWMFIAVATFLLFAFHNERARKKKAKQQCELLQGLIDASKKDAEVKTALAKSALDDLKNQELFLHLKQLSEAHNQIKPETWAEIENLLNTYFPDFIPKFRGIHTYNDTEWKLSLLLKMGFSWQEIAILIGRSYDAVYSSQTRLLKKVFPKGSEYPNWLEFISTL